MTNLQQTEFIPTGGSPAVPYTRPGALKNLTTLFRNLFQHSFPNPLESLARTEPQRFAAQLASLAQIVRSARSFYRIVLP